MASKAPASWPALHSACQRPWPPCHSGTCQANSCPRVFTGAVPSTWNPSPPCSETWLLHFSVCLTVTSSGRPPLSTPPKVGPALACSTAQPLLFRSQYLPECIVGFYSYLFTVSCLPHWSVSSRTRTLPLLLTILTPAPPTVPGSTRMESINRSTKRSMTWGINKKVCLHPRGRRQPFEDFTQRSNKIIFIF